MLVLSRKMASKLCCRNLTLPLRSWGSAARRFAWVLRHRLRSPSTGAKFGIGLASGSCTTEDKWKSCRGEGVETTSPELDTT